MAIRLAQSKALVDHFWIKLSACGAGFRLDVGTLLAKMRSASRRAH